MSLSPAASAKILIVEDEPRLASVLRDYLAAAGMTSEWVDDGGQVIDAFARYQPDLVLLDLVLLLKKDKRSLHGDARFATGADLAKHGMFKKTGQLITVAPRQDRRIAALVRRVVRQRVGPAAGPDKR